MKTLIINDYGVYLGLHYARLVVRKNDTVLGEYPLVRLKAVHIQSKGVSLSSDLVLACAVRGIKIFFSGYNSFSAISTLYDHKTARVRKKQFEAIDNGRGVQLAAKIIAGKIKNQRSTLLYASRYVDVLPQDNTVYALKSLAGRVQNRNNISADYLLGTEGVAAGLYFNFLKRYSLFPPSFSVRTKRYSKEITNIALNYGYAILQNYVYKAVLNAGLEPYAGVYHTMRSAKPSLVLDIMEEYRSFVVDRNIIKLRHKLAKTDNFDKVKKDVARYILTTMSRKYKYNNRKITLESIIQRQVYRIAGYLAGDGKYKPYVFRW